MNRFKRVVLIVLDGVGVGALPDAKHYGDENAATLPHVSSAVNGLFLPHLQSLGLGNICPIEGVLPQEKPQAFWGKMSSSSIGKDSVTGHWELAGLEQKTPFTSFPRGFPPEIIQQFEELCGVKPLGNIAASGTDILRQLGEEHLATGRPIVYTSSDSVFQIAAHEDLMTPSELYQLCEKTLEIVSPYGVCRVIARPFVGSAAADFLRTSRRHDFPVPPTGQTLLDALQSAGVRTCGLGKIGDLFAGRGLDVSRSTVNNDEGLEFLMQALKGEPPGLIFLNLVDFDMLYGHRLDSQGFAGALQRFDQALPEILGKLTVDDLLIITADHGCDPTTPGTDHTREFVPLLVWSSLWRHGRDLGVRRSFSDVAATISEIFAIDPGYGTSFLSMLADSDSIV